jgi:hypothetical protein
MLKKYWLILAAGLLMATLPGCSHSNNKVTPQAPAYAAAITETMLQALNDGDYQSYSLAFNDEMLLKTQETVFNDIRTFIHNTIGTYKSKKLSDVSVNGTKTTVVYTAKFTNEPKDVTVNIVFETSENIVAVSDFWIVSPKLWEH